MNRGARPPGTHTTSFWTPATDARLRGLWDAGLSSKTIGDRLGCSKNSIIGRAHRLELKPRANPVKGAAETRARNKAAKAKLVDTLAEILRAQRASKPPAPAPRPVAPKPADDEMSRRPLGLWLPSPHICQWPIGHPKRPGFRFCGAPPLPDRPYCHVHCETAYIGFGRARADEAARVWQRGKGW